VRVPRVLASSNPGLRLANAFGVEGQTIKFAKVLASSNPGLRLANAFGVEGPVK